MIFPILPVTVMTDQGPTLAERIADIPGMPINAMSAAVIESMIVESDRSDVDNGTKTILRQYRRQLCQYGLHRHGEWRQTAEGGYFDSFTRYTGRVKTCIYCGGADIHETVYDELAPNPDQ